MSNKKKETIPDIIAEIRKKHPAEEYPAEYGGGEVPNKMRLLADRIEAAWNRIEICDRMNREAAIWKEEDAKYKYEIHGKYEGKWLTEDRSEMSKSKQDTIADIVDEINREFEKLRVENARLRAALKPVLECKVMSAMTAEIEPGKSEYCAAIIEKAQRIYSEGEENRNEGGAK